MGRAPTAALVAALLVGGLVARAQTPSASGSADIMPALLAEVRGLRAAMELMASAGARVQLALGRLQLQEQRLNTAIKRLDETRTRLTDMQRAGADQQEQLAAMEAMFRGESGTGQPKEGLPDRTTVNEMLRQHRREMARTAAEIQRLTGDEVAQANEVAAEQTRWSEFNQRIEELERGLAVR
jgi:chromosome segregation ATPase